MKRRAAIGNLAFIAVLAAVISGCAQGAGGEGSQQRAPASSCPEGTFACDNGSCIAEAGFCNNIDECGDASDEPVGCTPGQLEEPPVVGGASNCYVDQLVCGDGSCVDNSAICDGFADCNDQADRAGCGGLGQQCPSGAFDCGTGDCVPKEQRCDGSAQCTNGADEAGCGTKSRGGGGGTPTDPPDDEPEPVTCSDSQFTCNNGKCIAAAKRCNFKDDCGDNSDEAASLACGCDPSMFYTCGDGSCIPWTSYCDGTPNDCPGNEDESPGACNVNSTCGFDEFECYDETCRPLFFHCDGDNDCPSGEDELGCS